MVKKIMNRPENIVDEMLEGLVFANPELQWFKKNRVVARKEKSNGKVGIMTVGGSGHEPAHVGYIGKGMLDAAVAGNLFASPSPDQMLKAIEEVNYGAGVLVILKNYSGDLMNYSIAKEFAEMKGIEVDCVVVKDDVAVLDSSYSTGRRGIAGTIFIHKIAGAKAETGASLEEVKSVAQKAISNTRSMGMSMSACILPGLDKPGFTVDEGKIELGMGIHGEPGIEKMDMRPASDLARILFDKIMQDYDYKNSKVALLVNGLGSTPLMELYVLTRELKKLFEENNMIACKVLVGNYMTALEMAGCSVSIIKVDNELEKLIMLHCKTAALTI